MPWIDRAARRAAASDAPDRLTGLVERRNLTRRQALKGLAAGAVLAGPASSLLTPAAKAASCLRAEPTCARDAEAVFLDALRRCKRDSLWGELRCRVAAQNALTGARQACRVPDHARCPAGQHCDGSGACVAGDPPPPPEETGPVGDGPCAADYPTAASLEESRAAIARGDDVVNLSPGGCMRLERSEAGGVAVERMTLAGTVVAEHVTRPDGATVRRDDDGDGFFEYTVETTGPVGGETGTVLTRRDPQTKEVVRRETRTFDATTIRVAIEEPGEPVSRYVADRELVAAAGVAAADDDEGGYCGHERDAFYGKLLMKGLGRTARCLTEHGRPDIAAELLHAGGRMIIQCADLPGAVAYAPDAPVGNTAGRGRIIIDPEAMDQEFSDDSRMQTIIHEVMHYTSLGLHDPSQVGGDNIIRTGAHDSDRVRACSRLCTLQLAVNQCQCATCLEKKTCSPECIGKIECQRDMGAICPCEDRRNWYPTYGDCVADCPKGLKCFGYSKCKNLDRRCGGG